MNPISLVEDIITIIKNKIHMAIGENSKQDITCQQHLTALYNNTHPQRDIGTRKQETTTTQKIRNDNNPVNQKGKWPVNNTVLFEKQLPELIQLASSYHTVTEKINKKGIINNTQLYANK